MKKSYYDSIPERLRGLFPGFISDWDDEYVYPILFDLCIYVIENIDDFDIMKKLLAFIHEVFDTNDFKAKEAVRVQIMESAMDDKRLKLYLDNHLSGDALVDYNNFKIKY